MKREDTPMKKPGWEIIAAVVVLFMLAISSILTVVNQLTLALAYGLLAYVAIQRTSF